MSIIQLKEANCKSCYKCIRHCPVKSISFEDDQARIIPDKCVLCGTCTIVCPQNAKEIASDVDIIRHFLRDEKTYTVASLAPSYVTAFPDADFEQVSAALKRLGFDAVEEVAIGATEVSAQYAQYCSDNKMQNIITTCCPSVVMLVEQYFPDQVPMLAPSVSPAVAHARMVKKTRPHAKVVFIGPCISKKHEAAQGEEIDAVLMLPELRDLLKEQQIDLTQKDSEATGLEHTVSRWYPVPGGIIRTIPKEQRVNYKYIAIDGLERCIETLEAIRDRKLSGYFLEMSACAGSCVAGPGMHGFDVPFLMSNNLVADHVERSDSPKRPQTEGVLCDLSVVRQPRYQHERIPDEKTIAGILAKLGKTTPESMLNCGACGYNSCREKAIAVYQGKANLMMCLPYMREHAESLSNVIIETTPNALVMLDEDGCILQYNRAAQEIYEINENEGVGYPAMLYMDTSDLSVVKESDQPRMDVRTQTANGKRIVVQSLLPVSKNSFLMVSKDITEQEEALKQRQQMRDDTVRITQQVIDNQMRAAQEIASLLGETTGESKAALSKLKKMLEQSEG